MHPVSGALRFALELVMLGALGFWARSSVEGPVEGWLAGSAAVLITAVLWGVFNVPGDPSRSGNAPVPVPGWARLALELGLFAAGVVALMQGGFTSAGSILAGAVVVHYAWYWRRLRWLLTSED